MKTGLYFGSFNPVHNGHLMIASYMIEYTDLEQLWFVLSPQNPLKKKKTLLNDYERLIMMELAIEGDVRFDVSDVEFRMPKPSYTADTLAYLRDQHPTREFILIMGTDTLLTFHKWKNHELIQRTYMRYVYPRHDFDVEEADYPGIKMVRAPKIEISSTFIRESLKKGIDIRHFLPARVYQYIRKMHLYE